MQLAEATQSSAVSTAISDFRNSVANFRELRAALVGKGALAAAAGKSAQYNAIVSEAANIASKLQPIESAINAVSGVADWVGAEVQAVGSKVSGAWNAGKEFFGLGFFPIPVIVGGVVTVAVISSAVAAVVYWNNQAASLKNELDAVNAQAVATSAGGSKVQGAYDKATANVAKIIGAQPAAVSLALPKIGIAVALIGAFLLLRGGKKK